MVVGTKAQLLSGTSPYVVCRTAKFVNRDLWQILEGARILCAAKPYLHCLAVTRLFILRYMLRGDS